MEEQAELLASLLQESRLHVTNVLFLREARAAICTAYLTLDHRLEVAKGRVPILDVEGDVQWCNNFYKILRVALSRDLILYYSNFVCDCVDNICVLIFCHFKNNYRKNILIYLLSI